MNIVIFVIVLFLRMGEPQSIAVIAPDMAQCADAAAKAREKFSADPRVQDVRAGCITVPIQPPPAEAPR